MSVYDDDYAESHAEANDAYFGAPDTPGWDEPEPDEDDEVGE